MPLISIYLLLRMDSTFMWTHWKWVGDLAYFKLKKSKYFFYFKTMWVFSYLGQPRERDRAHVCLRFCMCGLLCSNCRCLSVCASFFVFGIFQYGVPLLKSSSHMKQMWLSDPLTLLLLVSSTVFLCISFLQRNSCRRWSPLMKVAL